MEELIKKVPLDFRGVLFLPYYHDEVMGYFWLLCALGHLPYIIDECRAEYPDCLVFEATKDGWRRVRIEIEPTSSGFNHYGREDECDLVVCWEEDGPCPLPVVSLRPIVERLVERGEWPFTRFPDRFRREDRDGGPWTKERFFSEGLRRAAAVRHVSEDDKELQRLFAVLREIWDFAERTPGLEVLPGKLPIYVSFRIKVFGRPAFDLFEIYNSGYVDRKWGAIDKELYQSLDEALRRALPDIRPRAQKVGILLKDIREPDGRLALQDFMVWAAKRCISKD